MRGALPDVRNVRCRCVYPRSTASRNASALMALTPSCRAYRSRMYSTTIRKASMMIIDRIHVVSIATLLGMTNSRMRNTNGSTISRASPARISRG